MIRFKNFNATGVAPDGRLFAGDLNQLQDLVAALSDFTQTHDVGTLRVGDASIQLLKYGVAEGRFTAAFRVDGILRGLGGIVPPTMTTAARDGLAPGSRPYGLLIQNTTTNRMEQNIGTDAVPVWIGVGAVEDNSITLAKMADNSVGAAEIIADSVGTSEIAPLAVTEAEIADGAVVQTKIAAGHGGSDDFGTAFPTTGLFNGYRFTLFVTTPQVRSWSFVYRADLDATYPWHFIGGAPLLGTANGGINGESGAITAPRSGYYYQQASVFVHSNSMDSRVDSYFRQAGTNASLFGTVNFSSTLGQGVGLYGTNSGSRDTPAMTAGQTIALWHAISGGGSSGSVQAVHNTILPIKLA